MRSIPRGKDLVHAATPAWFHFEGSRSDGLDDLLNSPDTAMEDILFAILSEGATTSRGLASIVESVAPGVLHQREGYLLPVLEQMRRAGRVESHWMTLPDGRVRRVHRAIPSDLNAPRKPWNHVYAPGAGLPQGWRDTFEETARDASRGVKSVLDREEARLEILGHIEDTTGDLLHEGLPGDQAIQKAIDALGDAWRIRSDLGAVHRGRTVVVFPHTFAQKALHIVKNEVLPIAIALALVLLFRAKVVQAYNIPSGSMEPTLHGSPVDPDYILVNKLAYLLHDPARWDVVVFFPPTEKRKEEEGEEPTAFVKRCVGLGGESIDFRGGDVWVDGVLARRAPDVEDAMLVPTYDLAADLRGLDEDGKIESPSFRTNARDVLVRLFEESWREREGTWSLEGASLRSLPDREGQARLEFRRPIRNSYHDHAGKHRPHYSDVGDIELRFELTLDGADSEAGADITEGRDRHTLRIGPDGLSLRAEGRPLRRFPGVVVPPGRSVEVRFRNVDDRVTVWLDGVQVVQEDLPARTTVPEDSEASGVTLVSRRGTARFGGVRIRRDIIQLRHGSASDWPVTVPEGQLFMVGDNSASSNDSRMWGPVDARDVIGSPMAVVFPPSRMRVVK